MNTIKLKNVKLSDDIMLASLLSTFTETTYEKIVPVILQSYDNSLYALLNDNPNLSAIITMTNDEDISLDITKVEGFVIKETLKVILDLNGHNIIAKDYCFTVKGQLEIIDSTNKGCVYNTNINTTWKKSATVNVTSTGKLTVKGGWFGCAEPTDARTDNAYNLGPAIRCSGKADIFGGNFTCISWGREMQHNPRVIPYLNNIGNMYSFVLYATDSGVINFYDGYVFENSNGSLRNDGNGSVNVYGGKMHRFKVHNPGSVSPIYGNKGPINIYYVDAIDDLNLRYGNEFSEKTGNLLRNTSAPEYCNGQCNIYGGKYNFIIPLKYWKSDFMQQFDEGKTNIVHMIKNSSGAGEATDNVYDTMNIPNNYVYIMFRQSFTVPFVYLVKDGIRKYIGCGNTVGKLRLLADSTTPSYNHDGDIINNNPSKMFDYLDKIPDAAGMNTVMIEITVNAEGELPFIIKGGPITIPDGKRLIVKPNHVKITFDYDTYDKWPKSMPTDEENEALQKNVIINNGYLKMIDCLFEELNYQHWDYKTYHEDPTTHAPVKTIDVRSDGVIVNNGCIARDKYDGNEKVFDAKLYKLTAESVWEGVSPTPPCELPNVIGFYTGTVNPSGDFGYGTYHHFSAGLGTTAQQEKIRFSHWNDDTSDTNTSKIIKLTEDTKTYKAKFVDRLYYIRGFAVRNTDGEIDTTWGSITGGVTGVLYGTSVTLKAVPKDGYKFKNWITNGIVVAPTTDTWTFTTCLDQAFDHNAVFEKI